MLINMLLIGRPVPMCNDHGTDFRARFCALDGKSSDLLNG